MTTRREWAHTLAERAREFDDLDDDEAESAIRGLIVEFMGAADFLMEVEVIRGRKARLAKERNSRAVPKDAKIDLSDLLPPVVHVPNPAAGPALKKSHPLGDKSIVGRRHR